MGGRGILFWQYDTQVKLMHTLPSLHTFYTAQSGVLWPSSCFSTMFTQKIFRIAHFFLSIHCFFVLGHSVYVEHSLQSTALCLWGSRASCGPSADGAMSSILDHHLVHCA